MDKSIPSLDALHDIRQMMQRSNRFISLSGFSGVSAGLFALLGAWFAHIWIDRYNAGLLQNGASSQSLAQLQVRLALLAAGVLGGALLAAFYFTWRRASQVQQPLWDRSARMLLGSLLVPLLSGGLLLLILLVRAAQWQLVVPLALIFYGLALVSGSRHTLSEIRYLGYCEVALGLVSTQFSGWGLQFWALGFGVLHIGYGMAMWWKYERKPEAALLAHSAAPTMAR